MWGCRSQCVQIFQRIYVIPDFTVWLKNWSSFLTERSITRANMKSHNLCCHPSRNATATAATLLKQYIFRGQFVAPTIVPLFTSNNRLLVKDKAYNTFDTRYSSLLQQSSPSVASRRFWLVCREQRERQINCYINCCINQLSYVLILRRIPVLGLEKNYIVKQ